MDAKELQEKYVNGVRDFSSADLSNADLRSADLSNADLHYANLSNADLHYANLSNADLSNADLRSADLRSADLRSADLSNADLRSADLRSADLRSADLRSADLRNADLRGADLPPPTVILLAQWGNVSNELCVELMRYDAANHPDPKEFKAWAESEGKDCPYFGCKWQRAANFNENYKLWSPGPTKSALELAEMLIKECTKTKE